MEDRYLFRGKRVDNGAWETGSFVYISDFRTFGLTQIFGEVPEHTTFIADKITGYNIPVDPATSGQCTGMEDKNGRLIFEGDTIKTNKGLILNVHYNKARYELGNREKDGYFVLSTYKAEELEIIGNMYDNPELLDGERLPATNT